MKISYYINNIFDKVYLLNLERDIDKLNIMKYKLDILNIEFEVFKAIDGSNLKDIKLLNFGNKGAVGCKMSHMKIIKNAKNNKYSKILILEDDLFFLNNFIEEFNNCYIELLVQNNNWELLYLGASNRTGKNNINFNNEKRLIYNIGSKFITGAYAIGYDSSLFDLILKYENDNRPFDDIIGHSVNKNNYICLPYLVYPNISKPSTTVFNNNQDQKYYNNLNYINKNHYF